MSEAAAWYYVGSFGQLGPLTLEQMEELIDGGVIEKSTYVWNPTMNDWLPAGNITDLLSAFKLVEPLASPPPVPGRTPPVQQTVSGQPQFFQPTPPLYSQSNSPARVVSIQPHGYPRMLQLPKSDKNRSIAGILQLIIPGAGRMYLGYSALGLIQLLAFCCTGIGYVWSLADGIMILSGKVGIDGYGRALED